MGGCPGGLTGEVWAHNPEDTGSDPRIGGKFLYSSPSAHPSVKRVPGLVLGRKCTGCSVLVRLFLSGAAPLDYGNAPLEFSRICSILGLFCA